MITLLDENFSQINHYISEKVFSKIFILVDENTHEYCLPILLGNLSTDISFEILEIEAGEDMKNIQTANQLWEILTEMQADRKALLINLGGGVITDMGGFVASTYKRGIAFINIPTTLLAMCDASIGGKTGIDLMDFKNMVGTFAHPEKVFISSNFLNTLPENQLKSGFAEMLKHGLIKNEKHWQELTNLKNITTKEIESYIYESMLIKQDIVEKDFHEKNVRKTLNFGHTIGHAIESLFLKSNHPILHGEAVAMGMICETHLSYLEGLLTQNKAEDIIENIHRYFSLLDITTYSEDEIFSLLLNDKKNYNSKINFSLLEDIGKCTFDINCSIENIRKSIEFYKNLSFF